MSKVEDQDVIIESIINGYRAIITDRYQLVYLSVHYDIPVDVGQDQLDQLRNYFLDNIYPPYSKRQELNKAFQSLDNHIKHPSHIMKIILDSSGLLFKYGFKLPAILKAGIRALKSFRTASRFEQQLVDAAIASELQPPFSQTDVKALIAQLPEEDIEDFMHQGEELFKTIYDTALVQSIIKILDSLISKMEKRPNVYAPEEVNGFKIGQSIITHGFALFENLPRAQQAILLDKIIEIERAEMSKLHYGSINA